MSVVNSRPKATPRPVSATLAKMRNKLAGKAIRHYRDEDGSATLLALYIFGFMLIMGGIGIDMMRHEMERANLQATLDAAVLAGAGTPTDKTAAEIKAIVEDYFAKAGMSEYLNEITDADIETTVNRTKVAASTNMTIDTYLMKLSGVETLSAKGAATAEIRTPKLEVSLVLDVSGSMRGTKLTNLQSAAKEFVTTMLASSEPGEAAISIIPFNHNVNPSPEIYEALTVNETHQASNCLRFDNTDFTSTAVDPNTAIDQRIYSSLYGEYRADGDSHEFQWSRSCYTDDYFPILPYSISETALHDKIDSLEADGNTSGHLGIKWGVALLDPVFSSVVTSLQQQRTDENNNAYTVVDPSLSNIPAAYNERDTLKVIVMMGDGANTSTYQFYENSAYRGANSDMWYVTMQTMQFKYAQHKYKPWKTSTSESKCSRSRWTCVYELGPAESVHYLYDANDNRYRNFKTNAWVSQTEFDNFDTQEGFVSKERLSWETLWTLISPDEYGDLTGDRGPDNEYRNSSAVEVRNEKDSRMRESCTAAKSATMVIYTIGYEISSGGHAEGELRACASSDNHYYPTDGAGISEAFASIASNVQNLRLTQ